MKRVAALALAITMIFTLTMNANATNTNAKEISSYEDTVAVGYDDYMFEVMTRGTSVPSSSKVWDFDDGIYDGHVYKIRTGVYTNYCFYPNTSGELYVKTNLQREPDANGNYHNWRVVIGIYDMEGKYIKVSKMGSLHTDSLYHTDEFTFTGLTTSKEYCFFISVYDEASQITGDVHISNSSF